MAKCIHILGSAACLYIVCTISRVYVEFNILKPRHTLGHMHFLQNYPLLLIIH